MRMPCKTAHYAAGPGQKQQMTTSVQ